MHTPISMPSAAFDDKRLLDLFYHYAGVAGGRGRGDDILRVEGINLGGHADSTVADIISGCYLYDQWAGHFYQAMTQERFVKLGIEGARLGLRLNCVVSRDLEYALTAYEAIDKEVPIRDRRWVVIHVNQASDAQIRRMQALGVIATASASSARRPSPSDACWMAACRWRFQPMECPIRCCGRRGRRLPAGTTTVSDNSEIVSSAERRRCGWRRKAATA